VTGWSSFAKPGVYNYAGWGVAAGASVGALGVGAGVEVFQTPEALTQIIEGGFDNLDNELVGISASVGFCTPGVTFSGTTSATVMLGRVAFREGEIIFTDEAGVIPGRKTTYDARNFASFMKLYSMANSHSSAGIIGDSLIPMIDAYEARLRLESGNR
jgi:hypothetical protein